LSEALEEVNSFTYFCSIVDKYGGRDAYVKIRIGKARTTFLQLNAIWTSKYPTNTNIRLFNTNVKSILLHRAETWTSTVNATKKI
jgi:hypothetical protein